MRIFDGLALAALFGASFATLLLLWRLWRNPQSARQVWPNTKRWLWEAIWGALVAGVLILCLVAVNYLISELGWTRRGRLFD